MFIDPFAPMQAVLNPEQLSAMLPLISFRFTSDRTTHAWLDCGPAFKEAICNAAGLSWTDMLQASATPYLTVELTDELVRAYISRCIYPLSSFKAFSESYYLCYIPENGRLFVHYHRIIGSRLLGELSPMQKTALFDQLVAQAVALNPSSGYQAIMDKSRTVKAQIDKRRAAGSGAPVDEPASNDADFTKPVLSPVAGPQSAEVLAQLALMRAAGSSLMLPSEHLSEYAAVKRLLETAGAHYVTRKKCFTFPAGKDAQTTLDLLLEGNRVNPKKEFQFFASTQPVLELMRSQLSQDLTGLAVLEPSAGDGALADMARELGANVTTVELWDLNTQALRAKGYEPIERDFLELSVEDIGLFDVIVANPPFTKGCDIEHFMHMTKFLKPEGRLCCVLSTSWQTGGQRKQAEFREFLQSADVDIDELPSGTFKESGTNVGAVLVTLRASALAQVVTFQDTLALAA